MPTIAKLQKITIVFNTHNDDRDSDTVLHVFVKNRSNTTSTPEGATSYIANYLSYLEHESLGPYENNPYLGFARGLAFGTSFDDPSTHEFTIPLRSTPVPLNEIILPVVNIHILPSGHDRWIFSYTITFFFDDGRSFSSTSNTDGITGIILDQDNRDYSGICIDNPLWPPPPATTPQTDAILTKVRLEFSTHNDDKNDDTTVNVHIFNRQSTTQRQDIAIGLDLFKGQTLPDPSLKSVEFPSAALPLASNSIRMQDMVLPAVAINIVQGGHDRWIFDYRVTYFFSDGRFFSSTTSGVILDQDNHKHIGVYQGSPFPTVAPLAKPALSAVPVNYLNPPKRISLSYLEKKLQELINNRQGVGSQDPPIKRVRIHNAGVFGGTLPESYYDVQSLDANPPIPGTIVPPGYQEGTKYLSGPTSLGQEGVLGHGVYFNDVNSKSLTVTANASAPTPLVVEIDFETNGQEILGLAGGLDLVTFNLKLGLTLSPDPKGGGIDVMSWIDEVAALAKSAQPVLGTNPQTYRLSGTFLGKPFSATTISVSGTIDGLIDQVIHLDFATSNATDPGDTVRSYLRGKILETLTSPGSFTSITKRESLNALVSSWFLGGVVEGGNDAPVPYPNPCRVHDVKPDGDGILITYTGPQNTFQPPVPAGWPGQVDFSPGTLANIDHIVVVTMENRSFDTMLGYLSLPASAGGMGRTDIDGLKGGEFNMLEGTRCPSFPFAPGDTIFSPDPPHDPEPVHQAINGGKMDGFAKSYADERGRTVGPRIMGYHTAANVPTYDALARDFAICNRWFAAHPGPTFCNRFYELTGRLNIDPYGYWETTNSGPPRPVFTPTIFDHLSEQGVSWKYFEHGYCFLRFFEKHTFDDKNIATFTDPVFGFENLAKTGNLPSVSFIDPHFIEMPPHANCDGPPANIADGQIFVQKIVEAVVASPKWDKTLLIVTYDEHGGFFDHVPPPPATKVSPESLDTYGVRVPAIIVTPWMKGGTTFGKDAAVVVVGGGATHAIGNPGPAIVASFDTGSAEAAAVRSPFQSLHFDHTSILKTIARRFLSKNPPYMGARYADARDLSLVLSNEARPSQFRPFIPYNLVFGASQKRLDVQGGSSAVGAMLWQYDPNTTPAQQFSLEDAGGGFYYIRTHTGSLYLTAIQGRSTAQPASVFQEPKRPAGGTGAQSPDCQRWKFSSTSIMAIGTPTFTISNAAFPGKVLEPTGRSTASGVAVVMGDPAVSHVITVNPNGWQVTSPLLPSNQVVAHQ